MFQMQCDFVLKNGTIITMDPLAPRADWVAVRDQRIAAVGTGEEDFAGAETIDLEGHNGASRFVRQPLPCNVDRLLSGGGGS